MFRLTISDIRILLEQLSSENSDQLIRLISERAELTRELNHLRDELRQLNQHTRTINNMIRELEVSVPPTLYTRDNAARLYMFILIVLLALYTWLYKKYEIGGRYPY